MLMNQITDKLTEGLYCQSLEIGVLRNERRITNGSWDILTYYLRETELHEVVPDLLEGHDDSHLQAQINQTATWVTLRNIYSK